MIKRVCFLVVFATTFVFTKELPLISLFDAIEQNKKIEYIHCLDGYQKTFKPFSLVNWPDLQPSEPFFLPTFFIKIPQGRVYSPRGYIFCNNLIIKDFMWSNIPAAEQMKRFHIETLKSPESIPGRVAVITHDGWFCYYHWMTEILGRLVLLEEYGIEYDWLYVTTSKPFMKDVLALWGIDENKIITPDGLTNYIQADELIVPSLVSTILPYVEHPFSSYMQPWIIERIRSKLLPFLDVNKNTKAPEKRIFISRKDARMRRVLNEDEVFALFEPFGFKRYTLDSLSLLEQMSLFNRADIIVASHGAGLTNLIFSKPGTRVIEFFQARPDATYWNLCQILRLNHTCIKTVEFDKNHSMRNTVVPLECFDEVLKEFSI
ncbi:MAG: glycosyltransferase family 61 protein [Candidatus Dependentiae bacterium]|nr:glycosyltransferase family 61 protein [Candidatus Dependentiae bacterium]